MPPRSVLVVDPNAEIRRIFRLILEANGYAVLEAGSGEDGLHVARDRNPNLVVAEHPLAMADGSTLTRALRTDPATSSIPIVTVTAVAYPENLREARAHGSTAVLTKPVAPAAVLAMVDHLLRPGGRSPSPASPPGGPSAG